MQYANDYSSSSSRSLPNTGYTRLIMSHKRNMSYMGYCKVEFYSEPNDNGLSHIIKEEYVKRHKRYASELFLLMEEV